MPDQLIIECPNCESKVGANIIAKREYGREDDVPYGVFFLECPVCKNTMVGQSDMVQLGPEAWGYEYPTRLWPKQKRTLDWSIPPTVRNSIEEAIKCYNARAFSACAVMCGRSLQALCKAHNTKDWQLAKGLHELRDKGIIDGRLSDWGEVLRDRRNIGAHATEEDISKEDASDVMDFTIAICEYVYVLTDKYEKFKKRELKPKKAKPAGLIS